MNANAEVHGTWARVPLAGAPPLAEWLMDSLDRLRDGQTRAVFLDATVGEPTDWRLTPSALDAMALFELPVVVAFEGTLARFATEVVLGTDIRVCSTDSALQGPLRSTRRALALAGESGALPLIIGQAVGASALLDAGLVSSVQAPGAARAEGERLAAVIASRGPHATRLAKESIWRGRRLPLEQALRFETDLTLLLQTTKDRAEGVRAFLEKRTPNFTGD
jgi:enoyl-CoA hydratase/carnithine racemase